MNGNQPAGWYSDPTGRYSARYWDGQQWSNQANSGGTNITDEVPAEMLTVQPVPGSEVKAATPPPPAAQPSVHVTQEAPQRSAFGAILAVIAVIAVVVILALVIPRLGNGDETDTTDPVTTEAPAETEPPATEAPASQ